MSTDTRDALKKYFENNKTPTQEHFEALIESGLNQVDDDVKLKGKSVSIGQSDVDPDAKLVVKSTDEEAILKVKNSDGILLEVDKYHKLNVNTDALFSADLKVNGKVTLNKSVDIAGTDGQVIVTTADSDNRFAVKNNGRTAFVVDGDNKVAVNKETAEATLDVDGDIKISENISIGKKDDSGNSRLSMTHELDSDADGLHIKKERADGELKTQMKLDEDGNLSLGLSEAQAQLHIYKHADDRSPIVRFDDNTEDNTPFIIDSEGKVGVGIMHPANKLDVGGSIRVGTGLHDAIIPENTIVVEDKIGVNTTTPDANLHIEISENNAVLVEDSDRDLIRVDKTTLATDNNIETTANLKVEGTTELNGNAAMAGTLSVAEAVELADTLNVVSDTKLHSTLTVGNATDLGNSLTVADATTLNGTVQINNDTTVNADATFKGDVVIEGTVKADGEARIAGPVAVELNKNHAAKANVHIGQMLSEDTALRVDAQGLGADGLGADAALVVKDGKVGIKTDNPQVELDVKGKAVIEKGLKVDARTVINGQLDVLESVTVDASGLTISETEKDNAALILNHLDEEDESQVSMVVKNGRLGLGTEEPESKLHLVGDALFEGEFKNIGATVLDGSVSVTGDAVVNQTLNVKGDVALDANAKVAEGLAVALGEEEALATVHIGQITEDEAPLQVNQFNDGSNPASALIVKNGQTGINTDTPEATLDVNGTLCVDGEADFKDAVVIKGTTTCKKDASLEKMLTVAGKSQLNDDVTVNGSVEINNSLTTHGPAELKNTLTVGEDAELKKNAHITKKLGVSLAEETTAQANVHVGQKLANETAFRVDHYSKDSSVQADSALLVKSGKVGINTNAPTSALEVNGSALIQDDLTVNDEVTVEGKTFIHNDLEVSTNIGIAVSEPVARLHLATADAEEIALQIDEPHKKASLIYTQGKLGVGTSTPQVALDVVGDAVVGDELKVMGRAILEHTLDVDKDALLKSDLTVYKDTELAGRVTLGDPDDVYESNPLKAQLYVADTNYSEALRIESGSRSDDKTMIVAKQGRIGIGTDSPRADLDIQGSAYVSTDFELGKDLDVKGNIEVDGSITVDHRAIFGSDTTVRGDLLVEDKTTIEEELYVTGKAELYSSLSVDGELTVKSPAILQDKLEVGRSVTVGGGMTVNGAAVVNNKLDVSADLKVAGTLAAGTDVAQARCHVQSSLEETPLLVEKERSNGTRQPLFKVDSQGNMGVGTNNPQAKLDVQGSAVVSNGLSVAYGVEAATLKLADNFQIGDSPAIRLISTDKSLGELHPSDQIVPTQAAIKAYIDNVSSAFGSAGQTITVSTQEAFDQIFNRGTQTMLRENASILLLPLKDSYDGGSNAPAYLLKNTVRIPSGVSITGFNPHTTRVVKQHAHCRFELVGSAGNEVKNVFMDNWSFDGAQMDAEDNGSAFYLKYARNCVLNCQIFDHYTTASGGAIYGEMASDITAVNIRNCRAVGEALGSMNQYSKGGAAYGLNESLIHADNCHAVCGGAVANCHNSQVVAKDCHADVSGGAAHRCEKIRLTANGCTAGQKGGGAYYCSDLICEGFWVNNNASEGLHVFANNNQTGGSEERHFWKGDYVGKRLDNDTNAWRIDNE